MNKISWNRGDIFWKLGGSRTETGKIETAGALGAAAGAGAGAAAEPPPNPPKREPNLAFAIRIFLTDIGYIYRYSTLNNLKSLFRKLLRCFCRYPNVTSRSFSFAFAAAIQR